jgi:hypothetical protein
MAKTVVGSFDTFEHAREVIDALETVGGVSHGDVNLVANDAAGRLTAGRDAGVASGIPAGSTTGSGTVRERDLAQDTDTGETVASGAGKGAVAGGVIGGTAGLIAGLAGLALPGIGPLVAAGPIAAALTGAGIGAVAGGLIGGLRQVGVSDTDAEYYAEAVRRGGALVIVRAEDDRAEQVAGIMRSRGAIDIESRVAAWRQSGWKGFDPSAQPYTHDDIERERVVYRSTPGGTVRDTIDDGADLRTGTSAGTRVSGTTSGTVGGSTVGTGLRGGTGTEHPNLGRGPDRPGIDTRGGEHARNERSGMAGGTESTSPGGSVRSAVQRASDAIERKIPGDSDGDGR